MGANIQKQYLCCNSKDKITIVFRQDYKSTDKITIVFRQDCKSSEREMTLVSLCGHMVTAVTVTVWEEKKKASLKRGFLKRVYLLLLLLVVDSSLLDREAALVVLNVTLEACDILGGGGY